MRKLFASCFGLGWLPVAPGTWGSLPPAIVFALMCRNSIPPMLTSVVMAVLALTGSVICIKFAPVVVAAAGKADPREVVVDEFAGQAVAFLVVSFSATGSVLESQVWAVALLGFVVFRVLDIAKPWPIRKLEKLPKGWGILADDLLAGAYAGIVLLFCLRIGLLEHLTELFGFNSESLNIFKAAVLGAAQGLTEFLPVSSSGHLVLFEKFFGFNPEEPQMLLFDLATHVGTVVAIFVVFRKSIAAFFKNLSVSAQYGPSAVDIYKKSPSAHLLVLTIVATVVTAVPGILFKDYFVSARGNLTVVASMWIITGTLLLITDWRKKTRLSLRRFGILAAMLVGLAQAAAIMPGISRSGVTICTAILVGLHRRWAVEFSFLIAIPAILGATAVQLAGDFGEIGPATLAVSSVLAGSAAAAFVGILALRLLIKTARTANLKFFAFYCYILAAFVLFFY